MINLPDGITVAVRENNDKRKILFVNENLGKHIPVSPNSVFNHFNEFSEHIVGVLDKNVPYDFDPKKQGVLILGFAETATALAKFASINLFSHLGKGFAFSCTTREKEKDAEPFISFKEEHSHAPEHFLYLETDKPLGFYRYIILIDDEITTGNTAVNFIEALKNTGEFNPKAKFIITAPFINKTLSIENSHSEYDFYAPNILPEIDKIPVPEIKDYSALVKVYDGNADNYPEFLGPTGSIKEFYDDELDESIEQFSEEFNINRDKILKFLEVDPNSKTTILILGTEECMFNAIMNAEVLQGSELFRRVRFHATTRSPIIPQSRKDNINYPVVRRADLPSFYDSERKTYIYNLAKYDRVLVISDAEEEVSRKGRVALLQALKDAGNENVMFVSEIVSDYALRQFHEDLK